MYISSFVTNYRISQVNFIEISYLASGSLESSYTKNPKNTTFNDKDSKYYG